MSSPGRQSFDEFAQQHEQKQKNRKRLTEETRPEWEVLKGFTSQFDLDAKGFDKYKFRWITDDPPFLVLNDVAATFLNRGERNGVPQSCSVRFSRRPPGVGRIWSDENSPLAVKTWTLEPMIENDDFVWFVSERAMRLSSADLAEEIGKELAQYHVAYEKAYGRSS